MPPFWSDLREHDNAIPPRELIDTLSRKVAMHAIFMTANSALKYISSYLVRCYIVAGVRNINCQNVAYRYEWVSGGTRGNVSI